jgi:hypothetical protein
VQFKVRVIPDLVDTFYTPLNHLSFAARFGSLNFAALNNKDGGKSPFANERTERF